LIHKNRFLSSSWPKRNQSVCSAISGENRSGLHRGCLAIRLSTQKTVTTLKPTLNQLAQFGKLRQQGKTAKWHVRLFYLARAWPAPQLMDQIEDGTVGGEKASQNNNMISVY